MKKIFISVLTLLMCQLAYCQSTDLDREYFSATYVNLPTLPIIDNELRTYSTDNQGVVIQGFSKVDSNASIVVNFNFGGTTVSNVEINTHKYEKKDKSGKVLSVSYTYTASARYTSKAILYTVDNLSSKSWNNSFRESKSWVSNSFRSYKKAQGYYNNNRFELKSKYQNAHRNAIRSKINSHLNRLYGYTIFRTKSAHFWILGSKKHPEYQKHHEAFETLKGLFATMRYNEPTDKIAKDVQASIDYFIGVTQRYEGKKRKARKIRYASYYNIAQLYYYLDNVHKCKEYATKLIENNYDKSDGKYFLRIANALDKKLVTNKTSSRHMEIVTEDLGGVSDNNSVGQSDKSKKSSKELVYLITQSQDTIKAVARNFDEALIGYGIELFVNNKPKYYKSEECKTLAIPSVGTFKAIKFKDAATSKGGLKLVKELFSSSKISLYEFQNKELVLKLPKNQLGTSLMSADFAFGFNKALIKFSAACPSVLTRIENSEFSSTKESLIEFCKAVSKCE